MSAIFTDLKMKLSKIFIPGETVANENDIIENEIKKFKTSKRRTDMLNGEKYYIGNHEILTRKRTVIGVSGELEEVINLPNNKIVDNQYKKMVDQKNNYLLGQPITFTSNNSEYVKALKEIFDKRFLRTMRNIGEDSINSGISWLYIYYNENGEIDFKRFKPYEVIPIWKDNEHTILNYAIRLYETTVFSEKKEKVVEKVEIYSRDGIDYFEVINSDIYPCEPYHKDYFSIGEKGYNWSKVPLIPFKYNNKEIPLINMVKSLQDGLNLIVSNFQNQMQEDARNTILVLSNYDGENLGEFRKNLSTYGVVKVKTVDGSEGSVKTLQVEVNADNYKSILEVFKKAIIENAMGYDAKDDRLSGNANQMNIQSMYSDIDLDANGMETEFQASFFDLIWFINAHLYNTGVGDFYGENIEVIFNRDILINESEAIDNLAKSQGILSNETIIANHPWVDDPLLENQRLKKQQKSETSDYEDAFKSKIEESTNIEQKSIYKITSILAKYKKKDITLAVALKMLMALGFDEIEANELINDNSELVDN